MHDASKRAVLVTLAICLTVFTLPPTRNRLHARAISAIYEYSYPNTPRGRWCLARLQSLDRDAKLALPAIKNSVGWGRGSLHAGFLATYIREIDPYDPDLPAMERLGFQATIPTTGRHYQFLTLFSWPGMLLLLAPFVPAGILLVRRRRQRLRSVTPSPLGPAVCLGVVTLLGVLLFF